MAQLTCPTCQTPFVPANVNISLGVASCASCNEVHDLSRRRAPPEPDDRAPYRTLADGAGLTLVEGPSPSLSYPWRHWVAVLFLGVWCVFWNAGLFGVVGTAILAGEVAPLMFSSLHLAVGVAVTYFTVAMAVNQTTLRLDGEDLTVSHAPLPWPGSRALSRRAIDQVYVVEDRGSKGSITYSVHARVAPGHPVKLVGGLGVGRARFLESWLEERLGVVDGPVSGEHF